MKTIHNEEENGNIAALPLLMGLKIGENKHGKVIMTMNLSYNLTRNLTEQDFISFATGVGAPISSTTSLMGEFSTVQGLKKATEDSVREQLVKANIGMITLLGKKVLLFGSVGSSLVSSDEKQHLFALGGVRWLAGGI